MIRFFGSKHDKHYLIYNVCAERQYDKNLFDGRVERIETVEHAPPRVDQLVSFVEHVAPHFDAVLPIPTPVSLFSPSVPLSATLLGQRAACVPLARSEDTLTQGGGRTQVM